MKQKALKLFNNNRVDIYWLSLFCLFIDEMKLGEYRYPQIKRINNYKKSNMLLQRRSLDKTTVLCYHFMIGVIYLFLLHKIYI